MNRNSKKMLKLAVSIGMIVLGVYMTFFRDVGTNTVRNTDLQTEQQAEREAEQQVEEQGRIRGTRDYSRKILQNWMQGTFHCRHRQNWQ